MNLSLIVILFTLPGLLGFTGGCAYTRWNIIDLLESRGDPLAYGYMLGRLVVGVAISLVAVLISLVGLVAVFSRQPTELLEQISPACAAILKGLVNSQRVKNDVLQFALVGMAWTVLLVIAFLLYNRYRIRKELQKGRQHGNR